MKQVITFFILLNICVITAQTKDENFYNVRIESGEEKNLKSCEGYFFATELTKNKINYTAILATKAVLNNSTEIRLFLNTKEKPLIVTLPIKTIQIIQDKNNDLIIIPFGQIYQMIENKEIITKLLFLTDDVLLESTPEIKESDFSRVKSIWEWEVNEAYKKRD